ncbi:hypothetical protein BDV96DRAFT_572173 [Lophiotrema nucula]|uniref:Uncharacterized protein n=1 Tax=Lophiotrema nucula TaxID=690887 RepID=A0A6A5ZDZ9_9PLEO|nr:hypothetical protein BDV96DRAFT_572173 [Lophiotrema nucula]
MASFIAGTVLQMPILMAPELRNMIYEETFFSSGYCIDVSRKADMTRLALFASSKLYHQEAASYFYANGIFVIDGPYQTWADATILPPIVDRYVTHLRRIDLRVRTGRDEFPEVQHAANTISALGKACIAAGRLFEEVHIRLELPIGMTPSLSREFDDAVMGRDHCITKALLGVFKNPVAEKLHLHLGDEVGFATGVAPSLQQTFDEHRKATTLQVTMVENGHEIVVTNLEACEWELSGKYTRLTGEEMEQCQDGSAPAEMILRTLNNASIDIDMKDVCLGLDDDDDEVEVDMCDELMPVTVDDAEWKAYEEMILFTPELLGL